MIKKGIAVILLIVAVTWSFSALMPSYVSDIDADKNEFSTARALMHLETISQQPHAVGSDAHTEVRNYIVQELGKLGFNPQIQQGFTISKWGNMAKPKNIVGRLKGSKPGKALLLLSHYDSSPHSSYGASDAGSGVVTILEGLRAFLHDGKIPDNDIIVVISDAEEQGLNGADLFVNQHEWADDVGLVLNFEARGSGGPSYMLIETNSGNSKLISNFIEANPEYPVANSLAYSIYKMLPNDTDLTRFREDGDIDGLNFAFIDDHFDYHTSNDTYERLDRETLEHQGSYLMPLLTYFSQSNLENLKSSSDHIYFNVPVFRLVSYPFSWIWPMLIVAFLLFAALIFYGFKKRRLNKEDVLKGFAPFVLSLVSSAVITYALWFIISQLLYTSYNEILHGFTYNGHTYITAFSILSLAICFWFYAKFHKPGNTASLMVAPITFWLIICAIVALKLKGASFFVVPVYFALISLFVLINQRKPNLALMALLCFPVLMIMSPFIKMFPVGLGLGILFVSAILISLIFGFLLGIFGFFKHKRRWSVLLFITAFIFLISAHFKSSFNEERPKPNSLVYMHDIDTKESIWATYDDKLDDFTKQVLGEDPISADDLNTNNIQSKYRTGFSYTRTAESKVLLYPEVDVFKDTLEGDFRSISLYIEPKRNVQRIELFSDKNNVFKDFTINGISVHKENENSYAFENRSRSRLFTYYISDNEPLEIHLTIPQTQKTKLVLYESSNDLLENRSFNLKQRSSDMIPKPFVLNDAIILKQTISLN